MSDEHEKPMREKSYNDVIWTVENKNLRLVKRKDFERERYAKDKKLIVIDAMKWERTDTVHVLFQLLYELSCLGIPFDKIRHEFYYIKEFLDYRQELSSSY